MNYPKLTLIKQVIPLILFAIPLCSCRKQQGIANKETISTIVITDVKGRKVETPKDTRHIICSGPGCLRYATYLKSHKMVVGVDDLEKRKENYKARPYSLANPQFRTLPIFGNFRGHDNPELIVALKPQPQIIFKTYCESGYDPDELHHKTGIPVVALEYGDLTRKKDVLFQTLRLMGNLVGSQDRAEEVISFFKSTIADLAKRTLAVSKNDRRTCYIGGISFKGPHGFLSTEPGYASFTFANARNVAHIPSDAARQKRHMIISKEKIIEWNPEIIFLDASSLIATTGLSVLHELKNDSVYRSLKAIKNNEVYILLPYNSYTTNFGSVLANAYFIGKILYPNEFADINPEKKADEIFDFLVEKSVFSEINDSFGNQVFEKVKFD